MTLTQRERATYQSLRKNPRRNSDCMLPLPAADALREIKWARKIAALPLAHDGDTWETEDGFTVTLKIEGDYNYSLQDYLGDGYGEITDGKPDRDGVTGVVVSTDRHGRERAYFPSRHWTFKDRLAQYREAGMARNAAYLAAMAGLKKEASAFEKMHDDGVEIVWLQCKAYRTSDYDEDGENAEEWGEDSIGGVDGGDWKTCLCGYALHENALGQARKAWAESLAREARQQEQSRPDLYSQSV